MSVTDRYPPQCCVQLDKTFKREFGGQTEIYDELQRAYRDRRRGLTGNPIRSVADVLSKVPEGVQQHAAPPSPCECGDLAGTHFD